MKFDKLKKIQNKFIEKYGHLYVIDSKSESGIYSIGIGVDKPGTKLIGICVGIYKSQELADSIPDEFEGVIVYKKISNNLPRFY